MPRLRLLKLPDILHNPFPSLRTVLRIRRRRAEGVHLRSGLKRAEGNRAGPFHTSTGLAALPASAVAGFLWDIRPEVTFICGAVAGFIASGMLMTIVKKEVGSA